MSRSTMLAALPAFAAAALAAGCAFSMDWDDPDVWVEETERFDLPAGELDGIAVETHDGRIVVRAAADDAAVVRVTAVCRAGADDEIEAREALACLEVARRTSGSTLELEPAWSRTPRKDWGCSVAFEVEVPARFAARLESHNGACTVMGLQGGIDVLTHNGPLHLDAPARHVAATTHNGEVEYRGPAGEVAIRSHNGPVKATLTGGPVNGRIETHNGAIVVDAADGVRGTLEGETRNGRVHLRAPAAGCMVRDDWFRIEFQDPDAGRLAVTTHNGPIDVY